MKYLLTIIAVSFLVSLSGMAQEVQGYAMTKQGASIQYSMKYGKKIVGYMLATVQENKTENEKTTVTTLWKALNKKEKPSKSAALGGWGDGMLTSITLENGAYYMTMDLGLATNGENRHGYILKMPATLKVGDTIEGGTLNYDIKYLGITEKSEFTYNNFKVIEELDLTTPAGTFHCLKVTGNVKGKSGRSEIDDNQVWYIAPGMGIIRQEMYYMGAKRPIILEAYKVNGL